MTRNSSSETENLTRGSSISNKVTADVISSSVASVTKNFTKFDTFTTNIDNFTTDVSSDFTLNLTDTISANGTRDIANFNGSGISFATCGLNEVYHCAVFIICTIIFVAGFIGNIVAIFFLSTRKEYRKNATFVSINLLCVSDVLALTLTYFADMFASPEDWAGINFSTLQCTALISVSLSPFLLSCYAVGVLAVVRYHLVAYPMRISKLRSRKFIIFLYVTGAAIFILVMAIVGRLSLETMSCYHAMYYNGNLVFTHPPAILATVIFLLSLHAMKVRRLRQSLSARTYNVKASIRRINIIIYIIMCLFIICQLPFIINDILQLLDEYEIVSLSDHFFKILYNIAIIFYILNHVVNPYIYFISYLCFKNKPGSSGPASMRSSIRSVPSMRATSNLWWTGAARWNIRLMLLKSVKIVSADHFH